MKRLFGKKDVSSRSARRWRMSSRAATVYELSLFAGTMSALLGNSTATLTIYATLDDYFPGPPEWRPFIRLAVGALLWLGWVWMPHLRLRNLCIFLGFVWNLVFALGFFDTQAYQASGLYFAALLSLTACAIMDNRGGIRWVLS